MFQYKRAVQFSLILYALVVVMYIIYGRFFLENDIFAITHIIGFGCLVVALLSGCLIKNHRWNLRILYLCMLTTVIVSLQAEKSGILCVVICLAIIAITVVYMEPKCTVECFFCSNAIIAWHIIFHNKDIVSCISMPTFLMLLLIFECGGITLVLLCRSMKNNTELLKEKMEEAVNANNSKSTFLANMSHEIRTPLNAISGMAELILRENPSTEIRENGFGIKMASKDLLTIINDILDISKIEAGKMSLVETEYEMSSLINDIVHLSLSRLGNKNLQFFVECNPQLPTRLYGDEVRIKQMILNLVTNAIKYTKVGSITFIVDFEEKEEGILLKIAVKDTGIGIQEDNVDRLFDIFTQADTKRNRQIEGTGLGLSIVKQLTSLMNGTVNVKSKYGEGSTFSISISQRCIDKAPFTKIKSDGYTEAVLYTSEDAGKIRSTLESMNIITNIANNEEELYNFIKSREITHIIIDIDRYKQCRQEMDDLSDRFELLLIRDREYDIDIGEKIQSVIRPVYCLSLAAAINKEPMSFVDQKGAARYGAFVTENASILIVDDNEVNLMVARKLIRPYKLEIDTAIRGAKAIEMMGEKRYDIIFMDHMMPEMDGVEATKIIRETPNKYFQNVPIVALTANAVSGARQQFIDAGMNDFLPKPIDVTKMEQIIRKFLPKEKIIEQEAIEPGMSAPQEYEVDGIDVELGVANCGGDFNDYVDILKIVYDQGAKRSKQLLDYLEDNEYKGYTVNVHALKSTAANIGAMELSELAKKHETAGKVGDYEYIRENAMVLVATYEFIIENVGKFLLSYEHNKKPLEESLGKKKENSKEKDKQPLNEDQWLSCIMDLVGLAEKCQFDKIEEKINDMLPLIEDEKRKEQLKNILNQLSEMETANIKDDLIAFLQ